MNHFVNSDRSSDARKIKPKKTYFKFERRAAAIESSKKLFDLINVEYVVGPGLTKFLIGLNANLSGFT